MELIVLVKKAQSGDDEAMQEISGRFSNLVKKYASQSHVLSIKDEAEAQGWLEVVQGIRDYEVESGIQFAGYIDSRVRYGIWNLFKRERRRWENESQLDGGVEDNEGMSVLEKLMASTDVASQVEQQWLVDELSGLLTMLPEKQRIVIVRNILGGERLSTLAIELNVTPQGIYNLRKRGLGSLKKACAGMYLDIRP